ncbi:PREDICTED: protein DPCD isoform X2 [Dinoponera quadriceps]|uniref:Protein DPCD n=1 Tax=Dinoponera quadriceps TaxID=609295 RepID=A0A6P3Y4A3_DINQU|nr:PREDICTED: protein DPCD isoform X2 [Dinoponera quadriceps]
MMSPESWLKTLQNAQKNAIIQDGKRKVHYMLQDKQELVEEYNMNTNVVVRRAWRKKNNFGKAIGWSIEVGESEIVEGDDEACEIRESSNMPIVVRRITKRSLEWRIRNLRYPKDVYSVTAEEDGSITVRTSNRKYFKKLEVPDLQRIGLKPKQDNITFTHQLNTLIITYKKPKVLLDVEGKILAEVLKLNVVSDEGQCKTS